MTATDKPLSKHRAGLPLKDLDPDLRPWERQPKEPEQAWACFQRYRDAGDDRQIRTALDGRDPKQGSRWAYQWRWRERVEAYDRHLDAVRVRAKRRAIESMADRHAGLANAALGALQQPIAELVKRIQSQAIDLSKISDRDLLHLVRSSASAIKELVTVERLSRGVEPGAPIDEAKLPKPDEGANPARIPAFVVMSQDEADAIRAEKAAQAAAEADAP